MSVRNNSMVAGIQQDTYRITRHLGSHVVDLLRFQIGNGAVAG